MPWTSPYLCRREDTPNPSVDVIGRRVGRGMVCDDQRILHLVFDLRRYRRTEHTLPAAVTAHNKSNKLLGLFFGRAKIWGLDGNGRG